MSKLYQLPEEEKNRIRNLHLAESKDKKISSVLNEATDASMDGGETRKRMGGPEMTDAGNYHMWENCSGGQVVALTHDQTQTANGQSCHNAANQNPTNPGLVLACTQALINQYGSGPVIQWGTGAGDANSCWKYLGTQFFNTVPSTASPNQGSNAPHITLQNCSQCTGTGGDLAWMCSDVANVGGTGCQQMTCPYGNQATNPAMWNTGGGCWDNQIDCNNGGSNPSPNAQPCGGYTGPEHECVNGQCIPWQGGQYPTLSDCQVVCGPTQTTNYCVNCVNQVMSSYPNNQCPTCTSCNQLPGGPWVDVGTNPSPQPGPCHECDGQGNCSQGNGWNGHYNSMNDCTQGTATQQACQPGVDDYECISNQCQITAGGQYNAGPTSQDNLNACQAVCGQVTYDCIDWTSPSGCQSVSGPGGTFPTLNDCLASPCQCDDIILTWNFYTNNPNNPQGNWDGAPSHDGPSNQNALSVKLTAVQNTPAYLSNDPTNPNYQNKNVEKQLYYTGKEILEQRCRVVLKLHGVLIHLSQLQMEEMETH